MKIIDFSWYLKNFSFVLLSEVSTTFIRKNKVPDPYFKNYSRTEHISKKKLLPPRKQKKSSQLAGK